MAYDANDLARELGVDALRAAWDRAAYRPDVCEARVSRRNGEAPSSSVIVEHHTDAEAGGDKAEVARLAALSPFDYDRCRTAEAERLGVRTSNGADR